MTFDDAFLLVSRFGRVANGVENRAYLPTHVAFPKFWRLAQHLSALCVSIEHQLFCALSSVVEHYLHTVGVAGSKPAARTILDL